MRHSRSNVNMHHWPRSTDFRSFVEHETIALHNSYALTPDTQAEIKSTPSWFSCLDVKDLVPLDSI